MLKFYKYQGTGNDFVVIDQRETAFISLGDYKKIKQICDRKFGVGADGLIILQSHPDHDFEMVYFNADGQQSSMCGNGGRCMVAFAHFLGIRKEHYVFQATDGRHEALMRNSTVELKMNNVENVTQKSDFFLLNTGSPHYVQFLDSIAAVDVEKAGRQIRYSNDFHTEGINVNFVEIISPFKLNMATYERGVEAETLSCGTGATAAAIAYCVDNQLFGEHTIEIETKGGQLTIHLERTLLGIKNIWLCGDAIQVFEGIWVL